jgi:hypothetical protein
MKRQAFSLVEILLALGVLAIGVLFVGGVFFVGIHFSTITTERTVAAVIADEAFVKIRLYGEIDITWVDALVPNSSAPLIDVLLFDPDEFAYPSDPCTCKNILEAKYCWAALCRRIDDKRLVQVTVFVSRRVGTNTGYRIRNPDSSIGKAFAYPVPVPIKVSAGSQSDQLVIEIVDADARETTFINDDYTIMDDSTGQLYRVRRRLAPPDDAVIVLNREWQGGEWVWAVPPPASGGRCPCLAVYQKVIMF